MVDATALPNLSTVAPIVTPTGLATTDFVLFLRKTKAAIDSQLGAINDALADIADQQAALAAQQQQILDILNGTEQFSALNVNGDTITSPVTSVAGRTGDVVLLAADISDLGDSATLDVGTAAGTVSAGDDSRIVGATQRGPFTATADAPGIGYVTILDNTNTARKVQVVA